MCPHVNSLGPVEERQGRRLEERLLTGRESLHAPHLLDVEVAQVLRRFAAAGELRAERGREALAETLVAPLVTCDARLASVPGHGARVEVY
jgi:predicted nucleic acid-binding protein